MSGAICGGVVKQSKFDAAPWVYMMAYILPDDKYDDYVRAKREKRDKDAKEIFNKYAHSVI